MVDYILVFLFLIVYGLHKSRVGFVWTNNGYQYKIHDYVISIFIISIGLVLTHRFLERVNGHAGIL